MVTSPCRIKLHPNPYIQTLIKIHSQSEIKIFSNYSSSDRKTQNIAFRFSLQYFNALKLQHVSTQLHRYNPGWGLKRKENLADVLSPVDGVIIDVNPMLRERPDLANREPYGEGWLFTVRTPNVKGTAKKLMAEAESLEWINGEVTTLEKMIEDVAGPMAADGGFLAEDIYGNLPSLGWNSLTKTFLKTG